MTQQDLKHALISLVLGVLITALSSLVLGALHIFADWLAGLAGGATTTTAYLHYKHFL